MVQRIKTKRSDVYLSERSVGISRTSKNMYSLQTRAQCLDEMEFTARSNHARK